MVESKRCTTQMLPDVVWKLLVLVVVLHVAGCSVIIEGPSNVTIAEGSNVTLKCRTSLDITVEWLKSNYTLNLTNPMIKAQYSIDENNSLIIQNVRRIANVGMYECIVRNGSNVQERSRPAWVLVPFVHFSSNTTKKTIYIGETYFRFRVQWLSYPEPHVSWQLPPSITTDRFTFENSSTYFTFAGYYVGDATITAYANSSEYVGNYTASIDNGFQFHSIVAGILEILDECSPTSPWKCSNRRWCFPDILLCSNLNVCGDFSSETNCSLPEAPVRLKATHSRYNSILLYWRFNNMRNVYNITTLIQVLSVQGHVIRSIENTGGLGASFTQESTRIEGLQNDTTYTIVMRTKTYAGISVNATSINFTIPRMVAPGAPANFSVTGSSRYTGIWVTLHYGRPKDDGGSRSLFGYVRKCLVDEPGNITRNCTTDTAYLGGLETGTETYYDLQEKTKYYFALHFRSDVYQIGPKVSLFFTTPSRLESYKPPKFNSRGLSDAAIVGIVLSCCLVFFAVHGAVCKKMSQSARSGGTSVAYFPPAAAESKHGSS